MTLAYRQPAPAILTEGASALERRVMSKVAWRLVPLLSLVMLCAYLDRVNIGFAALQMNAALGLSNTQFGLAAGFFAVGYALFAIPSTLLLHKFGARRWIALIAAAWALCSAATAFVSNMPELLAVRFALGAAEAGFSPGTILYFSYWFPSAYRGRVLGAFLLINPLGFALGGPLSSVLLSLDGLHGLAGWRWLFLVEAAPSLLIAGAVLVWLTARPIDAKWLSEEERNWLVTRLNEEEQSIAKARPTAGSILSSFADMRVWLLAGVNLAASTAGAGATMFMPLIIRSLGFSDWLTGFVVAGPAVAAAISLPAWGWWADRPGSRTHVTACSCATLAIGLLGAALTAPSPWALLALAVAMIGFNGALVSLWTLPGTFLIGAGAAAGVGLINIAGNLGSFTGPVALGFLSDQTKTYGAGLLSVAACAGLAALLMTFAGSALKPRPPG